ncbi:MAG: hypothetical protein LC799_17605, partial [Actinobacteria bacterium]|nr:hypothetical protein [Actinomycetota bacterium]
MAMSNRDRVGRGFELLASGLKPFVDAQMRGSGGKQDWFNAYAADISRGRELSLDDSHVLLNVVKHLWEQVFRKVLGRSDRTLVFGLIDARNRWAHNESFSVDSAFSTLDS